MSERFQQFIILLRHFVRRFVYSDIIKSESHRRETVLILAIVLIGIGGYISYDTLTKLSINDSTAYAWMAKTYFITLMMVLAGIVSLVTWDKVLLDRKDLRNLLHLPVKTGTLVAAKFFSTFAFVVLVTFAFGLLSVFMFTGHLANKLNINPIYFAFFHLLTLLAANLFVFLFFSLLQSLLMLIFKEKWFKRISIFFQTICLAGLISVFAWFPLLYNSLPRLKDTFSPVIYWYPPLWFVGLNEAVTGSRDIQFNAYFNIVLISLSLLLILYLLISSRSYRRILKSEGINKQPSRLSKLLTPFTETFDNLFLKNLTERAIFYYVLKTLKRNWQYKAHLVVYIALPFGLMVSRLVYLYHDKLERLLFRINGDVISIQLTLGLSLVVGLRTIVLHPDNPEANWIFKVTDITKRRYHYIAGVKKALVLFAVVPLFLVFFLVYTYFWGVIQAFFHSFYGFSITLLVLELFFLNYKKIPFTSAYISGKVNIKFWWPFMLAGFVGYVLIFTRLELFLMGHFLYFTAFYILVYSVIFLIRRWRKSDKRRFEFIFEEEPELVMTSLDFQG